MSDNPYAPPAVAADDHPAQTVGTRFAGDYAAEWTGSELVISRDAEFPNICLKCSSKVVRTRQPHEFQYIRRSAILSVLLCTVLGLLFMLLVRQTAKMGIPLCGRCDARWRTAKAWKVAGVVVLLTSLGIPFVLELPEMFLLALFFGLGAFSTIQLKMVRPPLLRARYIDADNVTILGVHPRAARYVVKMAEWEL